MSKGILIASSLLGGGMMTYILYKLHKEIPKRKQKKYNILFITSPENITKIPERYRTKQMALIIVERYTHLYSYVPLKYKSELEHIYILNKIKNKKNHTLDDVTILCKMNITQNIINTVHNIIERLLTKDNMSNIYDYIKKLDIMFKTPKMYEILVEAGLNCYNEIPLSFKPKEIYEKAFMKLSKIHNFNTIHMIYLRILLIPIKTDFLNKIICQQYEKLYFNYDIIFNNIPQEYLTSKICTKEFETYYESFYKIPDEFKTKIMCEKYLVYYPERIDLIPTKYLTKEICEKAYNTYNSYLTTYDTSPSKDGNVLDKFIIRDVINILLMVRKIPLIKNRVLSYDYIIDEFKGILTYIEVDHFTFTEKQFSVLVNKLKLKLAQLCKTDDEYCKDSGLYFTTINKN